MKVIEHISILLIAAAILAGVVAVVRWVASFSFELTSLATACCMGAAFSGRLSVFTTY